MKIKAIIRGFIIALAVIFFCGVISALFVKKAPLPTPKVYDYTIHYLRADTGEDILKKYDFMLKRKGEYPIGYNEGTESFKISELNGKLNPVPIEWGDMQGAYFGEEVTDPKDHSKSYSFCGWYLDKECTVEFGGTIHAGASEDITLYAKIIESTWIGPY